MKHHSDKPLEIDLQKLGQDIKNIRYFLSHLEALLNEAVARNVIKDIENDRRE